MAESKGGMILAGGAALAAAIALYNSNKAKAASGGAGPLVLDEATMQLLVAIAQNGADVSAILQRLVNAGQPGEIGPITVQGYPSNTDNVEAQSIRVDALDTGVQLPDIPVLDGMSLVIKGFPRNAQIVFVGKSQAAASNVNQSYPLIPNELVRYYVTNANVLWFAGITGFSAIGDMLTLTVEARKGGG